VVVRGKENAEFSVQISGKNTHVILERNRAFLILKHCVRSVLEIQATDSDYIFCHPSPRISAVVSLQRSTGGQTTLNPQVKVSKIGIEIQVEIEDVLLWSVIHTIWISTESVLWVFVRFR